MPFQKILCYSKQFISYVENQGKPLKVRRYIGTVSLNNITRLTFGKRFINSKGELDPLGKEFKAILSAGRKTNKKNFLAEHLPWLRWLLMPLDKEKSEVMMHNARLDRFTREIMEEHAKIKSKTGGAKQHFVDALLSLKDEYDLSEDTVIGLLWVCAAFSYKMISLLCYIIMVCVKTSTSKSKY